MELELDHRPLDGPFGTEDGLAETEARDGDGDGLARLEALLELPRSAAADPLADLLSTAAETIAATAGFASVAINLFRPAWDDYEVVHVLGSEAGDEALLGTTSPRDAFRRVFTESEQPLPGVFFLEEGSDLWADLHPFWTPELSPRDEPDAWRAGDGLLAFLTDSSGEPLAFVSMDEPRSARRPDSAELRLIHAVTAHTAQALESAARREAAADHNAMLSLLLETAPALVVCTTVQELLDLAVETIVPALGFERCAAYRCEGAELTLCATRDDRHRERVPTRLSAFAVDALLDPALEQAGCFLGDAAGLFGEVSIPAGGRSARNGDGAGAWRDHCLVVPCRLSDGELLGIIVAEDPSDRRLPSLERRRALRLLADQVAGAIASRRREPSAQAGRGANRRALDHNPPPHRETGVLVCELDLPGGSSARAAEGSRRCVGELLGELVRTIDVPLRLADDEICLVLPGTDRAGAARAAERLRVAAAPRLDRLLPGATLTISVGSGGDGVLDARTLGTLGVLAPVPPRRS